MNLLIETIELSKRVGVTEDDIRSIGLTWRWYTKVRDGFIRNPGVNHVLALRKLAEKKAASKLPRKGRAA